MQISVFDARIIIELRGPVFWLLGLTCIWCLANSTILIFDYVPVIQVGAVKLSCCLSVCLSHASS